MKIYANGEKAMLSLQSDPLEARGRGQSPMGEQGLWKREERTHPQCGVRLEQAAKQDDFIYVCANTHNCCLSKQVFPQNSGSFDHLLWALYYMHNIQSQF